MVDREPSKQAESFERRIETLEAREAIKELRYNYCYSVDNFDRELFMDLFAPDAVVTYEELHYGTYEGYEELQEYFDLIEENRSFMAHMVHNPVIKVDGDGQTASGKWYFEEPALDTKGKALWVQGRYDETYKIADGEWKFDSIEVSYNYIADYDEGWENKV